MTQPMRTLLLADDATRDRCRALVRGLPCCQLIGESTDGEEGLHFASLCQPDVILLGADGDVLGTVRRLNACAPWARIVALSDEIPESERAALIQAGVSEWVRSGDDEALVSALSRLGAPEPVPDQEAQARRPGQLLTVYGPKGGAGRSTLAVNLAIALFRATGRETILVDGACYLGDLDLFLNLQPQQGLSAVLSGSRVDAALTPHPTGIKLLAWTKGDRSVKLDKLRSLMLWLKQRDAWVVVDTHPALREAARAVLDVSDRVLVPMALDIAHLRAVQRDLAQLREERLDTGRFEFVAWHEKSDVTRQEASKILRCPIQHQLPFEPQAVRTAINQGIPMLQAEPNGPLARELGRLVEGFAEPGTMALVPLKAANPFSHLLAWLKKGPATGYGA